MTISATTSNLDRASHVDEGDELIARFRADRKPHLHVISGPSGVGKDAVIEHLRTQFQDVYFAVTATTRERRPGEIDGIHYHFLDVDSFETKIAEGEFLEHAEVYGQRYGVPRWPVRQAIARGQDVIVKVDVQGAATIRSLVPHGTYIFIAPESLAELLNRLRARKSEDPDILMRRFNTASRELSLIDQFDYVIFNEAGKLPETINQIGAVLTAQRCRLDQPTVDI